MNRQSFWWTKHIDRLARLSHKGVVLSLTIGHWATAVHYRCGLPPFDCALPPCVKVWAAAWRPDRSDPGRGWKPLAHKYDMRVNELFAGGSQWEWIGQSRGLSKARFVVEDQTYEVWFAGDDHAVHIGFMLKRDGEYSMGKTGTGNAAKVLSTVVTIIKSFVDDKQPSEFYFSASGDPTGSRARLYSRMANRLASMASGYVMTSYQQSGETHWSFNRP